MSFRPLENQVALVTGSGRGIGAAIAKRLASNGASIVLLDMNASAIDQVAEEIVTAGGTVLRKIQADLSNADVADAVAVQLSGDTIDILVNNAGIAPVSSFVEITAGQFDSMVAINMRSVFFLTQALLPRIRDGGRIINISSSLKKTYAPGFIAYVSIKGFIEAFTKYLAGEIGTRGITVNAISPGAINTGLNPWFDTDEGKATLLKDQALKTLGMPEYIADAAAFLASPNSNWISGAILDVDGGFKLVP
ncbi:SDR family oxidoreductase [Burkholderia metallica]|uniref:SDR family NAD(P)-dependent oxidoreductase n=1 Tax=Burkholderia metallica TaxID=488729 RepID=UPI00157A4C86|nr:SDR family oxidoreductase [Burkholderia metallica]NTZ88993.1 SDR family oxidoreductase [Burkholderia metallica]